MQLIRTVSPDRALRAQLNEEIEQLLREVRGLVLVKGVLTADNAQEALRHGVDGIVVSNHGGRQVDGAMAALDALVEVRDALPDAVVLMDGGIRRAADVLKAVALGADAVLLGRPYVYGLALGGQDGVRHVLRSVLAELDLTLALSGFADLAQLRGTKDAVKHLAYTGA